MCHDGIDTHHEPPVNVVNPGNSTSVTSNTHPVRNVVCNDGIDTHHKPPVNVNLSNSTSVMGNTQPACSVVCIDDIDNSGVNV